MDQAFLSFQYKTWSGKIIFSFMALNQQRKRPIMMLGGVYTTKTIDTKGQFFRRFVIYFFHIFKFSVFLLFLSHASHIYSVNIRSIFEIDCEIYSVFCFYHIWNVLHMSKCTVRRCRDVRTSRSRLSWTDTDRHEHDWHQNLLAIKANIFGHFENSLVRCFCHICEEPHMSKCTDEMTEGRTS